MYRIDFDAGGAFAALDRARAALEDMTPIHKDIGEYMLKATKKRFLSGTAPDGTRWRQKSPTTLAEYARRGDAKRIVPATDKGDHKRLRSYLRQGGLNRPLIGPSGRLGKEIIVFATRDGVEIGSALEYSAVMQEGARQGAFGTNRAGAPLPWGDIPARPFLGISDDDERIIINIVDQHISDDLGG